MIEAGGHHLAQHGLGPHFDPAAHAVGVLVAHGLDPEHGRGHLPEQALPGAFSVGDGAAVQVAVDREPRLAPYGLAQQGLQLAGGLFHHGAVESAAHLEFDGASAVFLGLAAGQGHGVAVAADHELGRGVVIGHDEQGVGFGGGLADQGLHIFLLHLEDGGHAARAVGIGLGHEAAAQGHDLQHGLGIEHFGGGQGAEFA